MVLAIEADGASYRDSRSARDRDRLRKEHLERLGWTFHRIWSTNWLSDPDSEAAKVEQAYRRAVGGPASRIAPSRRGGPPLPVAPGRRGGPARRATPGRRGKPACQMPPTAPGPAPPPPQP